MTDAIGQAVPVSRVRTSMRSRSLSVAGCSQEAWLFKQLYVERKFGRRSKKFSVKTKQPR